LTNKAKQLKSQATLMPQQKAAGVLRNGSQETSNQLHTVNHFYLQG
jgi:hypothetical protein